MIEGILWSSVILKFPNSRKTYTYLTKMQLSQKLMSKFHKKKPTVQIRRRLEYRDTKSFLHDQIKIGRHSRLRPYPGSKPSQPTPFSYPNKVRILNDFWVSQIYTCCFFVPIAKKFSHSTQATAPVTKSESMDSSHILVTCKVLALHK
jgi:hypothetical protein